jgi:hypothetical protein
MLLPPLCTQSDYINFAKQVNLKVFSEPLDISKDVAKTWYVYLIYRDMMILLISNIAVGTFHGPLFNHPPCGPLPFLKDVTAWPFYKLFVR